MLKIIEVNSQAEKQIPLSSHKPLEHTWVVADLNSKAQIQTGLLQKYKCLPENAVLRISELWQKILHQSFADIEVVSSHFVSTVLAEWLKKRDLPWARHPGTPKMLTQYIAQFLPILIQPQVSNKMREWLLENPDALMRWGNWFELSDQAWGYFCKEKMLSVTWVSAYLSARDWGGIMWNNRLMIDIGADITGVEIDLFKKLAQDIEVTILSPPSVWCEKYSSTLWAYNILSERPAELKTPVVNDNLKNKRSCRYTTQISEVKAVVAQVRQWLERDVPTEKIAILAADIEQYWPSLQSYLFKEGVPVAKDVVMRAGSVPGVSKWLARIKIESRDIDSGDLEASVFGRDQESPINYEKFQQLFNKIYDDDDLNRDLKIRNLFDFKLKSTDRIDREEFFAWAIRFWFDDLIGIDRISAEILKECPVQVRLELSSWISYLVALVAKIEIKISEGPNAGVICSNFDAAKFRYSLCGDAGTQ